MRGNLRSRLERMRASAEQKTSALQETGEPSSARPAPGDAEFPAGWSHVVDGVRSTSWCSPSLGIDAGQPLRLAVFSRRLPEQIADQRRVAFFDFETTGLSGGVGTIAFLAAIGRIDQSGSVCITQYFLDDYPAERAFIQHVSEALSDVDAIATYNGSSFDMPLLTTRRIMLGLGTMPAVPHVDVLHPVRRLYRQTIGACALSNIEAMILDSARDDDIAGAEVPDVWFDFVKKGRCTRLEQVFSHNRLDIVSLARLFYKVGMIANGLEADSRCDMLGRAEIESRVDCARAEQTLQAALRAGDSRAVRALMRLYRLQQRWHERLELVPLLPDDATGLFSRSVYAERVDHNLKAAHSLALRSMAAARPGSAMRQRAERRAIRLGAIVERISRI